MPRLNTTFFDWALWFQWIMANVLGWILGRFLLPNLAIVTIGVALGVLQWLILLHRIRNSQWWILATILGWTSGSLLILVALPQGMELFSGVILGLTTGTAQWLILRREVYWAGWWIVINLIAWTTGMVLLPGLLSTGATAGALSGVALELLLRYPKPKHEP
jgi:hypothetical protein